ncbi:phosphate ABC transporter, periplasmic phosphate-binding protein [Ancylobacter novellus DSM 506]|uniref:Phosphate-binding protein PstS n=1 Tax=Ancylobacter novellus (strain ATCC 8093 / DSM 506 / JCM 20403 / CCM 1077 / IAM 12100 / NBRC 12443 / NCIMB 10456) TaxID=639283 RepID=D7A0I8_ANCN5|nr:phosphate ABC transporter substrate-binding protein PstS [Ancylobacter novellus]ADH91309.1 phosphate ABC transporter, periplasmic phosphate-binding protein [Ancylobacter novellus DSM 506]
MKFAHILGVAALSFGAAFSGAAFAADINGAGASFPAPVYQAWAAAYKEKTGTGLNYQSIGSGGGQNQIVNRTVDFGASDAPMDDAKLEKNSLLQFPTVIGSVVAIVNLGEDIPLTLNGAVLAEMYQGKITKWNDPKIAALNKGAKLPDLAIVPVYRSDSSGTSFVFTSYLSSASADWKSNVGAATSVQWPAGAGAKGNEGVAGTVKNTKGALGYVEFIYAAANKLHATDLVNKAGKVVKPDVKTFMAAASAADWAHAKNFAASMVDTAGEEAWPIVSATYILLPKNPSNAAASAEAIKFFNWAYGEDGDALAEKLHYIPLPNAVVEEVKKAWASEVKADGKAVWTN